MSIVMPVLKESPLTEQVKIISQVTASDAPLKTLSQVLKNWIQTMNQTGGNYRTIINGFLNSLEYRKRPARTENKKRLAGTQSHASL